MWKRYVPVMHGSKQLPAPVGRLQTTIFTLQVDMDGMAWDGMAWECMFVWADINLDWLLSQGIWEFDAVQFAAVPAMHAVCKGLGVPGAAAVLAVPSEHSVWQPG